MKLQELFIEEGYKDLLEDSSEIIKINKERFFDIEPKPEELLGIYVSKTNDEMFLVLNGDNQDINLLCDKWDSMINAFTIINKHSAIVERLKYNIVQLIICSTDNIDKAEEANLIISRKIIVKGNLSDSKNIEIDENDVVELPFYIIPKHPFKPDEEKTQELKALLPEDTNISKILNLKHIKENRKKAGETLKKSFSEEDFKVIREWMEKC